MSIIPGTTLRDLDETDTETLIPFFVWKMKQIKAESEKKGTDQPEERKETGAEGEIVYRGGKAYIRTTASKAAWASKIF